MAAMFRVFRNPAVIRGAQIVIGVIFAAAALAKIGDMGAFANQIHNFRLIPIGVENLVAMTLPWVELVAALSLVLGIHARAGGMTVATLMVVFLLAVGQAVARGLDIDCGCFGTADGSEVGLAKLAENVGLLALAVIASLPRSGGGS